MSWVLLALYLASCVLTYGTALAFCRRACEPEDFGSDMTLAACLSLVGPFGVLLGFPWMRRWGVMWGPGYPGLSGAQVTTLFSAIRMGDWRLVRQLVWVCLSRHDPTDGDDGDGERQAA